MTTHRPSPVVKRGFDRIEPALWRILAPDQPVDDHDQTAVVWRRLRRVAGSRVLTTVANPCETAARSAFLNASSSCPAGDSSGKAISYDVPSGNASIARETAAGRGRRDLLAAAMQNTRPARANRQAERVVDLGDRADRAAARNAGHAAGRRRSPAEFPRSGRRWFVQPGEELPRVGREGLDVAPLALGVKRCRMPASSCPHR